MLKRNHPYHGHVVKLFGLEPADYWALRKDSLLLHRWYERECGDRNPYASYCLTRDPDGKVWEEVCPNRGKTYRRRVADRETPALRRIAEICARRGLSHYIQTDPRGVALYIAKGFELHESNYTQGTPIH